jgi:hypothetical protein
MLQHMMQFPLRFICESFQVKKWLAVSQMSRRYYPSNLKLLRILLAWQLTPSFEKSKQTNKSRARVPKTCSKTKSSLAHFFSFPFSTLAISRKWELGKIFWQMDIFSQPFFILFFFILVVILLLLFLLPCYFTLSLDWIFFLKSCSIHTTFKQACYNFLTV